MINDAPGLLIQLMRYKTILKILSTKLLLILLLAIGSAPASVVRYDCGETNGSFTTNCGIGESQFVTNVRDNGTSATFSFQNIGTSLSIISDIYFDDTTTSLLNFNNLIVDDAYNNSPLNPLYGNSGVIFTNNGSPAAVHPSDLPGVIPFEVSFAIGRDKSGGIGRGINNASTDNRIESETLEITADYFTGSNFDLLLAALDTGAFRLGLKAQSFADGSSEWFTSVTTSVVPVPATVWLFSTALVGLVGFSKRRKAA